MTKVAGFLGFLKRNTTGSTYVTIPQILSIDPVGFDRNHIDVSAKGDLWEDIIPGRLAGRELSVTLIWDPNDAQHTAMFTDATAATQTLRNYELQHSAWTDAYRFPAYIVGWDIEATDAAGMEAHFNLKIVNPGISEVTPS
jgi:uncharacterized protein YbdZ (MbtH family)